MFSKVAILLFCGFVLIQAGFFSKDKPKEAVHENDSAETVQEKGPGDRYFSMQRLNYIWDKAIKTVTGKDQKALYDELQKLDKQFREYKHQAGEKISDKRGSAWDKVEDALKLLLAKYGLSKVYDSLPSVDWKKWSADEGDSYSDSRLNRLYQQAKESGKFDDSTLEKMGEKFHALQDKIDSYEKSSGEIFRWASDESNTVLQGGTEEVKKQFKAITGDYDVLKKSVSDKIGDVKDKIEDSFFEHPRVVALWNKAKAVFSGKQLAAIQEDLAQYQAKLQKYEWYKAAMAKAGEAYEYGKDKLGDAYEAGKEKVYEGAEYAKEKLGDAYETGKEYGKEKLQQGAEYTKEKAGEAYEYGKEKLYEGAEYAKEKAEDGLEYGKEKMGDAYVAGKEKLKEGAEYAGDKVQDGWEYGKDKAKEGMKSGQEKAKEKAGEMADKTKDKVNEYKGYYKHDYEQRYHEYESMLHKFEKYLASKLHTEL